MSPISESTCRRHNQNGSGEEAFEGGQCEADDARGPLDGSAIPRVAGLTSALTGSLMRRRGPTSPTSVCHHVIINTGAEGFWQCGDAQLAVDSGYRLIVATQLASNVRNWAHRSCSMKSGEISTCSLEGAADAGYCDEWNLSVLEIREITDTWHRVTKVGSQRTGARGSTQRRTGWSGSWLRPWAGNGNASSCLPMLPVLGPRR